MRHRSRRSPPLIVSQVLEQRYPSRELLRKAALQRANRLYWMTVESLAANQRCSGIPGLCEASDGSSHIQSPSLTISFGTQAAMKKSATRGGIRRSRIPKLRILY